MTNDLTLESARNLTDAQLIQALAAALSDAADGIRRGCVAVVILRERGIDLPVLPEVFRYAEKVTNGTLSARAGMMLARYPFAVNAVLGMDHDLQDRLAEGQKVKIAVKVNGRIQSAERTIWEMSQMQMLLAFTDGQITPWEQQGEWLIKAGHVEAGTARKTRQPRFNPKSRKIKVASGEFDPEEFKEAFAAAGLMIVPIYKQSRGTPSLARTA